MFLVAITTACDRTFGEPLTPFRGKQHAKRGYGFAPSEIHFIIMSASAFGTFRGPLGIDPLATNEYRLLVKALPGWTALPFLILEWLSMSLKDAIEKLPRF